MRRQWAATHELECTRGKPEENHVTRIRKLKEGYANKAAKRADLAEAVAHQAKLLRKLKTIGGKRSRRWWRCDERGR